MKVAVIQGGRSPERDISLRTGENAARALERGGHQVVRLEADEHVVAEFRRESCQVAFLACHGPCGEDGTLQGMLEVAGIPYTGSGVLASALANHKPSARKILACAGLPVPPGVVLERRDLAAGSGLRVVFARLREAGFDLPAVFKPATVGSSIGLSIARREAEVVPALEDALAYGDEVLVEEYVPGREVTVGILGVDPPRALPVIEIVPKGDFYNFDTKYIPGMSTHILPARLPGPVYARVQVLAVAAHQALGCYALSRVDLMVDEDGQPFLLEVNTIPGMTDTSLLPEAAAAEGTDFPRLGNLLLEWALLRRRRLDACRA